MTKPTVNNKEFPKFLYVNKDGDDDDFYYTTWTEADDFNDGYGAIYELKQVAKVSRTLKLDIVK